MKNKLLLPAPFRIAGLLLLLPSLALFIAWNKGFQFDFLNFGRHGTSANDFAGFFNDYNLTNELAILGMLASLIFIAFARVAHEDERSTLLRLQSLQFSHYCNYFILMGLVVFVNGVDFLLWLFALPFLFLVTFILIFYSRLYLLPKFANNEK
jgi:hypothetical protein